MAIPILSDIFGQKPQVAGFQDVQLDEEQLKSILANLKAFEGGNIPALGNLYQKYMTGLYQNLIPNFTDLLKQGGAAAGQMLGTAREELAGIVPKDVQGYLARSSAFQNLGSGALGSVLGSANFARNLGLTSLDMINRGANLVGQAGNAAARWAGLAQGTMLPPSSFLVTPQEQFAATTQNRLIQRQVQQERYNVAAAPNPIAKGLSDLVAYLTASYLGRGPAGKPPAATDYSGYEGQPVTPEQNAAMESAFGGQGGAIDQAFPGTYDINTGGGDFGGGGAVSSFGPEPGGQGMATGFDYGVGYPSNVPTNYYGNAGYGEMLMQPPSTAYGQLSPQWGVGVQPPPQLEGITTPSYASAQAPSQYYYPNFGSIF